MDSGGSKSAAFTLLLLNLNLYFVVTVIAASAVNHGIQRAQYSASAPVLSLPAKIFPMNFPVGNMATGFFVIFSLIAGVVVMSTSLTGITNVLQWDSPNLHSAAAFSLISWSLTLLAMGLACKEINKGWTRTLEVMMILVSGTQLLCTVVIHLGLGEIVD